MSETVDQKEATQPPPQKNEGRPIWLKVIADVEEAAGENHPVIASMRARHEMGIRKYGTPLQAHNGRNPFQDLFEEVLDALAYATQVLEEDRLKNSEQGLYKVRAYRGSLMRMALSLAELKAEGEAL